MSTLLPICKPLPAFYYDLIPAKHRFTASFLAPESETRSVFWSRMCVFSALFCDPPPPPHLVFCNPRCVDFLLSSVTMMYGFSPPPSPPPPMWPRMCGMSPFVCCDPWCMDFPHSYVTHDVWISSRRLWPWMYGISPLLCGAGCIDYLPSSGTLIDSGFVPT